MNKTFQTVTSVLIIILLFLLVWIFVSYYTEPSPNTVIPVINDNNNVQPPIDKEIIDVNKQDDKLNSDAQIQQDDIPDINIEIDNPTTTIVEKVEENINKEGTSVIISSDPNISNSDKQQVLTQIDEALSELLVVVDSVTIVDETRLGIDEEVEVQQ